MFLGSIGTKERGREFVAKMGFPAERLLADPEGALYPPLGMKKGLKETFLSAEVRAGRRALGGGRGEGLAAPALPPPTAIQKYGKKKHTFFPQVFF